MLIQAFTVSALAAVLLFVTGTSVVGQGTATAPDTETLQPTVTTVEQDDDGFDPGWLGLLGLAGLAGLAGRKRATHVDPVHGPVDPANRPRN
ncbi:hypothetical protein GTW51_21925 [Aurantimonas aggregata]|uniref:LPXTG cell wall anchor domain-containing protein n=1 Tax=Aurantimonas aggregata TaxID=2047720 RepID=A0A6L9MNL6_9HYPH|nr:hypothetical protein [Aurantimonas aggregata]